MSALGTLLLQLLPLIPGAINEFVALFNQIKGLLSPSDIATIQKALADAQSADATATAKADTDLSAASKK